MYIIPQTQDSVQQSCTVANQPLSQALSKFSCVLVLQVSSSGNRSWNVFICRCEAQRLACCSGDQS